MFEGLRPQIRKKIQKKRRIGKLGTSEEAFKKKKTTLGGLRGDREKVRLLDSWVAKNPWGGEIRRRHR